MKVQITSWTGKYYTMTLQIRTRVSSPNHPNSKTLVCVQNVEAKNPIGRKEGIIKMAWLGVGKDLRVKFPPPLRHQ